MRTRYRCCVVGDLAVGKSTLIGTLQHVDYCTNPHYGNATPTIGVDVVSITLNHSLYQIWDTGGQERFRAIVLCYVRGANIAIVCVEQEDDEAQMLNRIYYHATFVQKYNTDAQIKYFAPWPLYSN